MFYGLCFTIKLFLICQRSKRHFLPLPQGQNLLRPIFRLSVVVLEIRFERKLFAFKRNFGSWLGGILANPTHVQLTS